MDQVELSMLVDIGLKFYAVPCITTNLSDIEVNVFGHRFNRFSGKAQVRRATLSCDSSYYNTVLYLICIITIQYICFYRPITLESVISKIFQRTIARRLIWRLDISNGFAPTQDAYRKQVVNSIQEAKSKNEYNIAVFMDFESCFEKSVESRIVIQGSKD